MIPPKCSFLKPGKKNIAGEPVEIKVCTAFIPTIEIDQEEPLCRFCDVPKIMPKGKSCIYLTPLDFSDGKVRYLCRKHHKKYIRPAFCHSKYCQDFSL